MNQIEDVMRIVCAPKYLEEGEDFRTGMARIAHNLKDSEEHYNYIFDALVKRRFLPAGRIQASAGATRQTTAFNCFASGMIQDNSESIMENLAEAFQTLRLGGGDGFDFSQLRPKGALIKSLGSTSSGPISFMGMWDAMCLTIKSAGHRRGAMMGTMRIDHPDIEEFITAKSDGTRLRNFNISVLITDEFMEAVKSDKEFNLKFDGLVYKTVRARSLWDKIMRNTWTHAEPGVLFIDRINSENNLKYIETIYTTNPCGEQPLPPHGACLLGSINLTQYCILTPEGDVDIDWGLLAHDLPHIHRMMDNVIDRTIYPLPEQELEAKAKRRMGIGITGLANALEFLGIRYGSQDAVKFTEKVMKFMAEGLYMSSVRLAQEKGPFPVFDAEMFCQSKFLDKLPKYVREQIRAYGIRNSHLLSIAPTGTISLWAGNISSGIEPVFATKQNRTCLLPGVDMIPQEFTIYDYAFSEWGLTCPTSDEIGAKEHIDMLCAASKYVDSSCSKTCNVGDDVTFEEFENLYMQAYDGGAKGCTTFRPAALKEKDGAGRGSVLRKHEEPEGEACFIDPNTGERSCAD